MADDNEIPLLTENAVKLHGHLGPFLIIGVRMGNTAKKCLGLTDNSSNRLHASIKTPLSTPFSCVIDGIQATTSCTIGNQRLEIQDSVKEIVGCFQLKNPNRTLKISVNPEVAETLIKELSRGDDAERLALRIAQMEEQQLFLLEK
jgi:formylmethanofuran dehydrogenase subunit E